jgi:hypothetical protein
MRAKALFACLCLLLLSGCLPKSKDWTHPQMASPRKEDELFQVDSKFCEDKLGAQTQGDARDKAMADCLTRLGWQRKE